MIIYHTERSFYSNVALIDGGVIYSGEGNIEIIGYSSQIGQFASNYALTGNGGVVYCMKGDVIINKNLLFTVIVV